MNPRELVDHIRSGPAELVLDDQRFRPRTTHSNPRDFNEFLRALQSSETIRTVTCISHLQLGISQDRWILLVNTLGRIASIRHLKLCCTTGSRDFHPFQAVADAVNNAQSLCRLKVVIPGYTFASDLSGLDALANALQEHMALEGFAWFDCCPLLEGPSTALDSVLRALPTCPNLQLVIIQTKCASADAIKNLLQLHLATDLCLVLEKEHWLAVADEIRRGRCNVKRLTLTLAMHQGTTSNATEAVLALASAIQMDHNLDYLTLTMLENGFTDEAGVALAGALTVNTTLRKFELTTTVRPTDGGHDTATLGAPAYDAFSAMLRVNTSLVVELPLFDTDGVNERLLESHMQMRIEQRLNQVGRGRLLSSSQTPREEWVDALHELNSYTSVDDSAPAFRVSCLFSLLRLHPAACMS
jgi:hypothetical protein